MQRVHALFPWLVLLGALGLTVFAWQLTRQQAEAQAQHEFRDHSQQLVDSIRTRMAAYEQILHGARGLFAASISVERSEWRDYVTAQHIEINYPGVLGVGYTAYIPSAALPAHEDTIRAEGYPEYQVWPAGKREEYSAIIYLEPFTGRNLRAFGYDMYSEAIRHDAMQRARRSGAAALSGKVRLVQENGGREQAGTLLYLPIYRRGVASASEAGRLNALQGWAYMPFRMDDLMHGLLPQGLRDLDIELYDGPAQDNQLLYASRHDARGTSAHQPRFGMAFDIPLYGRHWQLQTRSTPVFEQQIADNRPQLVAVGGLAVSLLCFGFTWSLARTRRRALQMAEQITAKLSRSEERYSTLINLSRDGIFSLDSAFTISFANPHMAQMFGCSVEALAGRPYLDLVSPADQPTVTEHLQRRQQGIDDTYESELVRDDGTTFTALISSHAIMDANGNFSGTVSVMTDISRLKQSERQLAMLTSLIEFSADPFFVVQPLENFRLFFVNDAACRHFGMSREALLQSHVWQWDPHYSRERLQEQWQLLKREHTLLFESEHRLDDGKVVPVEVMLNYISFRGEEFLAGYFRDISNRRSKEAQVRHLAHHDALTGLPNRTLLTDRIKQALAQARRMETGLTLMFLDLDDFKPVNDTLGHDMGDRLLKEVAKRLQDCVRESDTVARLGGDEFVLLLPQAAHSADAETVARKVIEEIARPYSIAGHPIAITASLGIACYPLHAQNEQLLMKHADIAMYQSKRAGRNRYSFYAAPLTESGQ